MFVSSLTLLVARRSCAAAAPRIVTCIRHEPAVAPGTRTMIGHSPSRSSTCNSMSSTTMALRVEGRSCAHDAKVGGSNPAPATRVEVFGGRKLATLVLVGGRSQRLSGGIRTVTSASTSPVGICTGSNKTNSASRA